MIERINDCTNIEIEKLQFDDKDSRTERKKTDKLAIIFDRFSINCQNNYYLGEHITIDKLLIPFRGRCSSLSSTSQTNLRSID